MASLGYYMMLIGCYMIHRFSDSTIPLCVNDATNGNLYITTPSLILLTFAS